MVQFAYDDTPIIVTRRMSDIAPEPIQWLWPGRIALGKVTLLAGDPGLGKSMITVAMAAHVTNGTPWPVDRSECIAGDVIMVSAEDDPADTLRPRLDAAGADVSRVQVLDMVREPDRERRLKDRSFNLVKDIAALDKLLSDTPGCRLITIDPISAYLGGTDSHNNADIRALLTPLATMASRHKVAIFVVTHLNKSAQANALYRASGSLAFVAAARAAYSVVKCPDDPDRRLVLPLKNNLGDDRTGYAYQITTAGNNAPVLGWVDEAVEMTLEELAGAVIDRQPRPRDEVKIWLKDLLSPGPIAVETIKETAEEEGHAWRTINRAKKDLGIHSRKQEFSGRWEWVLPNGNEDAAYMYQIAHDGE
jgi:putative DNA primase/helicase